MINWLEFCSCLRAQWWCNLCHDVVYLLWVMWRNMFYVHSISLWCCFVGWFWNHYFRPKLRAKLVCSYTLDLVWSKKPGRGEGFFEQHFHRSMEIFSTWFWKVSTCRLVNFLFWHIQCVIQLHSAKKVNEYLLGKTTKIKVTILHFDSERKTFNFNF